MALDRRSPAPGLVHHSDRGVQYASGEYTGLLKARRITINMSRKGNPYDNAFCESFMKTLKYKEVHRQEYRDLADAHASIEDFLERVYNQKRLHSALGYCAPAKFEQRLLAQERRRETDLAFSQTWRGLPADVLLIRKSDPKRRIPVGSGPDFQDAPEAPTPCSSSRRAPAGYSSAGCSPALPASASPARPF